VVGTPADCLAVDAHACLDGDHEVRVALSAWTCAQVFDMDVYRIR
jgi:hypothetical protein